MTQFITKEYYENVVKSFNGISEESRKIMLDERFGAEFTKSVREGLHELKGKTPEELKKVYAKARAEAREAVEEPDFEADMMDSLKTETGIEFNGDGKALILDCVEIIIAITADMLGIA